MKEATKDDIGTACVFHDSYGHPHSALITNVHGSRCVNVAYTDKEQQDSYGQKIARATSVMHGSDQQAHGMYWLWPGEDRVAA